MELKLNERIKYNVIKEYMNGRLSRQQAAIKLGVTPKTISVMKAGLKASGKSYFSHKLKGNHPINKVLDSVADSIVKCYKAQFSGFNFSHFYELIESSGKLYELTHGEILSTRTIARILERHGITSPQANKQHRKDNSHPIRPRRLAFGELVQLDASIHDWLSKASSSSYQNINSRKLNIALHLAIDDSDSSILGAYFTKQETIAGYYEVFRQILENYGIPDTFYTDRRNVFWSSKIKGEASNEARGETRTRTRTEPTQFGYACQDLGIGIIRTSIAQAKGRVERSFRTHQDRLVNELRANHIVTIGQANAYLPEYIRRHNKRFAIKLHSDKCVESAFRPLGNIDINRTLSIRKKHKVLNGGIVSFESNQYVPVDSNGNRLLLPVDTPIVVIKTLDDKLLISYNGIDYQAQFIAHGRNTTHSPPLTHPWKRYYPK